MGPVDKNINKALLPIQNKAILSHIIEFFPKDTEFVIGVGHFAQQVRDYLSVSYPDRFFQFVTVDNVDGPGSGSGYSLLCCKDYLKEPFMFVPCDGLISGDLRSVPHGNWVGTKLVDPALSIQYCNFIVKDGIVTEIKDKEKCSSDFVAWSGVLFVHDTDVFWESLADPTIIAGESQISNGLKGLVEGPGLFSVEVNWTDVGDWEKYETVHKKENEYDFSKIDEFTFFVNNRVIKFFADKKIVKARIKKARLKPHIFPEVTELGEQFYSYPFVSGKIFYLCSTPTLFRRLLKWLNENVWEPKDVSEEKMKLLCREFYYNKTLGRLELFQKRNPDYQFPKIVNGQNVPPLKKLFESLPWDDIFSGTPTFIHGDLNFDNIIYDEKSDNFVLIDWRQDFAGSLEFGDLYYDISKLLGGILVNYDCIKRGFFQVSQNQDGTFVDFARRISADEYRKILEEFIKLKKLNLSKVRLITGISYLNMAGLHKPPYNFALISYGSKMITEELLSIGKNFE